MMLRPYQSKAIQMLYEWFSAGNEGHPCLVLPTGAGKSHIVAALCKDALHQWPTTRVLMLTHVKELLEQNAEKMRQHWPGAPLGIYSASVGRKELGEPITFAGIQSVRNKASRIGHVDLIIIDECHLVSHKDEGGYRSLIADLTAINPAVRVVGLTATPYRLGHGLITDKPALFSALIEPVTILELMELGHLAPLRSKVTRAKLDTSGVHKRGGEYIESELQAAVDTEPQNVAVVDEVIALAGDRKAWLFFCAGVQHSLHVAEALNARGIPAAAVTGLLSKGERERIIGDFKAGRLMALTNANVLTTGFDYPDIDLIAMLRPTMSASLYVQMAGRGLRPKSHTDHCLVLDFAGAVETHGPITSVQPPRRQGNGTGEPPVKVCDTCHELVHPSVKVCPVCGHEFPPPKPKALELRSDDIMGLEGTTMQCRAWSWRVHQSKTSGRDMLMVTYYGALTDPPVREYLTVNHDGAVGMRAWGQLAQMAAQSKAAVLPNDLDGIVLAMNAARRPDSIEYRKDGKFFRVMRRDWNATP